MWYVFTLWGCFTAALAWAAFWAPRFRPLYWFLAVICGAIAGVWIPQWYPFTANLWWASWALVFVGFWPWYLAYGRRRHREV